MMRIAFIALWSPTNAKYWSGTPHHSYHAIRAAHPDTVLIDTRNDYEYGIGTFEGAIDPETTTFREFPDWFRDFREKLQSEGRKPRIAMFCTGGIRCEKASSYMLKAGFEKLYHLHGGILKYLEVIKPEDSLWEGKCFVFDLF